MITAVKNISSAETLTAAVSPIRVLMAAGGTGGHVYPAIAIADAVKKKNRRAEILFVGTRDRMEWDTVPDSGYAIKSVWISGFHRRLTLQNLLFPLKLITSLIQSFMILTSFKPHVVVACGGFAAGPIGWVAAKMDIPIIVQEQNSFPGVTSRLLAKHARTIFTAFEKASEYFPDGNIKLAGNPVREEICAGDRDKALEKFRFGTEKPVLLVMGGSGGAQAINNAMIHHLDSLHNDMGLRIIWQCGERYIDSLTQKINLEKYPNLRLLTYIDDMPSAYGAADLALTRSGAGTCSELMLVGQPAILVPSPNVAGNHQTKNAEALVASNAASLLPEHQLDKNLTESIKKLIFNPAELERMSIEMKKMARPDAAHAIAQEIFNLAESRVR